MSVDPLAGAVTAQADLAALVDAEIAQLAADAQALRGLLVEGTVVTARVLPSNGLSDLLEIAGRRVVAALPPTVRPGDVLQAQVTGFDGDRILLQVLDIGADVAVGSYAADVPAVPPPAVPAPGATPAAAAMTPGAMRAEVIGIDQIPPAVPAGGPAVGSTFTSVVSRAAVAAAPLVTSAVDGELGAAAVRAAAPEPTTAVRAVVVTPREPTSIETRLAASRAAVIEHVVEGLRGFVAPPRISVAKAPVAGPIPPPRVDAAAPRIALSTPGAPRTSGLTAYAEPVALLRALRLPVTPSNVSSAALALQRPERLPAALAALERALPRASADPNVATLRTLLSFVGRVDPRSPTLAAQIAAYVDHVVDGSEPKLATLLAANQAAVAPDAPAAAPARDDASAAQPASPAAVTADAPDAPRPLPAAVAVERAAAIGADLKSTILAVAADPATPHALAPALAGALTALTAMQLGAAQALAAQPDGIAFTIPLTTPHGVSNAHITVKREAPDAHGTRVDPANFRIAFVLETVHYGTVAIDLVTVGRDVSIDVRTEAAPAMRAFRDALGGLTERLESLRYRVAVASASVGTTSTVAVEAPPSYAHDPSAAVDRSA